jgi:hypothetical protein
MNDGRPHVVVAVSAPVGALVLLEVHDVLLGERSIGVRELASTGIFTEKHEASRPSVSPLSTTVLLAAA